MVGTFLALLLYSTPPTIDQGRGELGPSPTIDRLSPSARGTPARKTSNRVARCRGTSDVKSGEQIALKSRARRRPFWTLQRPFWTRFRSPEETLSRHLVNGREGGRQVVTDLLFSLGSGGTTPTTESERALPPPLTKLT
jgi:hypothetical protein